MGPAVNNFITYITYKLVVVVEKKMCAVCNTIRLKNQGNMRKLSIY